MSQRKLGPNKKVRDRKEKEAKNRMKKDERIIYHLDSHHIIDPNSISSFIASNIT